MIKKRILIALTSVLLTGCASTLSSSFTKEGYTDNTYKKIAVIGINNTLNARLIFETEAVALLNKNGINAVKGIRMFPQNMSKEAQKPENLIKIINTNNLDGIITISLVDVKDGQRYQQGNSYNVPAGYYRVGKHIYHRYVTIHEPGYYEETKSYVIEAILYNAKGVLKKGQDTWVWTGESALINPSSLKSSAEIFCKKMVNQIIKDGIIAPQQIQP